MRYHTRCKTDIQKNARKILRQAVRGLRRAEAIEPSMLSSDAWRHANESHIRTWKRIIGGYHAAKTDADLVAAGELAAMLCESMVSMTPPEVYSAR